MGSDRLTDQVEKEARDLRILLAVVEHDPIGILRLAEETDVPEHKVRYSLRMLENDGLIEPTPQGAVPTEDVDELLAETNDGLDHLGARLEALKTKVAPELVE
jgi:predicted transcriptional regulator